jgi:hypothetical protein
VPLSNIVPRGFGFVHHSIAILYHQVPNPNITIRDFLIAIRGAWQLLDPGGGAFDLMARRVLCSNAHLGAALTRLLATVPDGDGEPHAAGYVAPPPQVRPLSPH